MNNIVPVLLWSGIGCLVVNGVILTGCAVPVMSPLLS